MFVAALLAVASPGRAQNGAAFDVASVKQSVSLEEDGFVRFDQGRFTVTNLSARWIIRWAYALRDYQVIDAPGWTETRYEVKATYAPPQAAAADVRAMTQRLLADRFALRARREQRNIRVYELVRAGKDAGPGTRLSPSDVDCGQAAARPPMPQASGRARPACTMFGGATMIRGFSRTMAQLATALDAVVSSPVIDRTGLTGAYDFDLQWGKPEDLRFDPSRQSPESLAELFTALREQLGLKLEPTRAPYDVLVIESIARPTAD
jgi:uncharacterized protein (TIGR03435 family)